MLVIVSCLLSKNGFRTKGIVSSLIPTIRQVKFSLDMLFWKSMLHRLKLVVVRMSQSGKYGGWSMTSPLTFFKSFFTHLATGGAKHYRVERWLYRVSGSVDVQKWRIEARSMRLPIVVTFELDLHSTMLALKFFPVDLDDPCLFQQNHHF